MKLRKDLAVARAREFRSSLIHRSPSLLRRQAIQHFLKLAEPNDVALRWRVGSDRGDNQRTGHYWTYMSGLSGARRLNPSSWRGNLLVANMADLDEVLQSSDRVSAVAYKIGEVTMFGVNEDPQQPFLAAVNRNGRLDSEGEYVGVVMRGGKESVPVAIGTASLQDRTFWPIATSLRAQVEQTPAGLHRV